MSTSLDDLVDAGSGDEASSFSSSLSDIASGLIQSISQSVATKADSAINNARSSNTQPSPDVAAAAARPAVSTFISGTAFGVSLPILLLGGGALIYLLMRK